jgi:hypothetical protein
MTTFRHGIDPALDELIDHYVETYAGSIEKEDDYQAHYKAMREFEAELRITTLIRAVRDVLAKLPLGEAFLARAKEHTEEAEKYVAESLALAKARGFDSVEAERDAEYAAQRSAKAKKAAATRAANRLDDAKRVVEGGHPIRGAMTIEQARKLVNEHTANQLLIDNGYVKDKDGAWVKPTRPSPAGAGKLRVVK